MTDSKKDFAEIVSDYIELDERLEPNEEKMALLADACEAGTMSVHKWSIGLVEPHPTVKDYVSHWIAEQGNGIT